MPAGRPLLLACFLLLLGGCMISEQIGEPVGSGTGVLPSEELTVHFDTPFNRSLVFGRSALVAALAMWIFSLSGKKAGGILVGVGLLVFAGWLVVGDLPTLTDYRIDVLDSGLYLNIPPEPRKQISWDSIEELELAGITWASIGGGGRVNPISGQRMVGVELPDWETMDITVAGGQKHTLNLKILSIEQRQILAQAIVKQADLVEEK